MIDQFHSNYKEALLQHPIGLQLILACTSIALAFGVYAKGLPVYITSYVQIVPSWVVILTFAFSGILSLASLNEKLLGALSNVINNFVVMFLWVWLAIGTIIHPQANAFAYLMVSPPLACLWVLAHSLLPKEEVQQ